MIWKQLIGGVNFVMVFFYGNYDNYLAKKNITKKTKQRIRTNNSKNIGKIKIEFGQMKRLCTFTLLGKLAVLH